MTDAAQRFTLLYDQYQPRVLAYARSRASQEITEEVTSATFLVAWERLHRLPDPVLPWLLAVARNLVRKHHAQAGRAQATVACWRPGRPPSPRRATSPRWWSNGRSCCAPWPACLRSTRRC